MRTPNIIIVLIDELKIEQRHDLINHFGFTEKRKTEKGNILYYIPIDYEDMKKIEENLKNKKIYFENFYRSSRVLV